MYDRARPGLAGKRLLVVEDEFTIATDLAGTLEEAGAEVVGPVGTVQEALRLVERCGRQLDGAVLDINLRDERVFPVAEALAVRGVPFVFTTGYDATSVPEPYLGVPRCDKPVDRVQLERLLSAPDWLGRSAGPGISR